MKPIIGILPNVDSEASSTVQRAYVAAVARSGGIAIMLPYTDDSENISRFAGLCDGFLFAGGLDVEPSRYGEEKREVCGETAPLRDEVEFAAAEVILKTGKPILGICRGCQLINVALGGTLVQDIPTDIEGHICHRATADGATEYHKVSVVEDTPLAAAVGKDELTVNSIHHQAIKRLGEGLLPMAYAPDGITEAAYLPNHAFLEIYQWHPERMYEEDAASRAIFDSFISAVKKEMKENI